MATYTGSGKWVKLQKGIISMGSDGYTYSSGSAYSIYYNGTTYYGMYDSTAQSLAIEANASYICHAVGHTGDIDVYTGFSNPYNQLIHDSDDPIYSSNIHVYYKTLHFEDGFLTGVTSHSG